MVQHTVMQDGTEIWHVGNLEIDDEPISIFPPKVPTYQKRWSELSGIEWMERIGEDEI